MAALVSHRVEAVNRSVSVSSWFADRHIAGILRQSAEMPLLPMLPTLAQGVLDSLAETKRAEGSALVGNLKAAGGGRQKVAVAIAVVHRLLEGCCGKDIFSRVVRQRYAAVYGAHIGQHHQDNLAKQELAAWRDLCSPEQREVALQQFGAEDTAAVDAMISAKKALFAELAVNGSMNEADAAGVQSEMMLDEAELTVALLLGDKSLLRFFRACSA